MKMTADAIRAHAIRHGLSSPLLPASAPIAAPSEAEPSPAQNRWARGEEKKLNALVVADLRRRGFFVIVSRTDKPTSQQRGLPDIIAMLNGKVVCCELKSAGGRLSQAQREVRDELMKAGIPICTAYGFNEAVHFVVSNLLP